MGRTARDWTNPKKMIDVVNPKASPSKLVQKKIAEAYEENKYVGLSIEDIANEFGVSTRSVWLYAKRFAEEEGRPFISYNEKHDF